MRELDKAEMLRLQGDTLELKERQHIETNTLSIKLVKEEQRLKLLQIAQLKSLLKRI